MLPTWQGVWLLADVAGLILGITIVAWEWNERASTRALETVPVPESQKIRQTDV
jgi:hypothetical protein